MLNFGREPQSKIQKWSDGKRTSIRMERYIFGRLLSVALPKQIDMDTWLPCPFSPFLLASTNTTVEM